MKAITLQQPWASLVAAGAMNIMTHTWQTEYRGRLAIHAGKQMPTRSHDSLELGDWLFRISNQDGWELWPPSTHDEFEGFQHLCHKLIQPPFGAIIATCELVDVAPIGGATDFRTGIVDGDEGDYPGRSVVVVHDDGVVMLDTADQHVIDITNQKVYNDFAPGRFAWILSDVKPVDAVRARGHGGLWNWELETAKEWVVMGYVYWESASPVSSFSTEKAAQEFCDKLKSLFSGAIFYVEECEHGIANHNH
jgi:hypothetical protein